MKYVSFVYLHECLLQFKKIFILILSTSKRLHCRDKKSGSILNLSVTARFRASYEYLFNTFMLRDV